MVVITTTAENTAGTGTEKGCQGPQVNHGVREISHPREETSTLCPLSKFPQHPQKPTSVMIPTLSPQKGQATSKCTN